MLSRDLRLLNTVIEVANSTPMFAHAKIGAAIAIGNTLYGIGYNTKKSHPIQKKFAINKDMIYPHAEIMAIKNAEKSGINFAHSTLYVARVWKNGKLSNAKPCISCQKAIKEYNIKKVIYTSDEGIIEWHT